MTAILPGAEPWSVDGTNGHGVLCLHGFTGNPNSMRPVAAAAHAAGFSIELPRLPGHGTTIEDMLTTSWDDWSAEAEAALARLAARVGPEGRVVVAGQSMGGTLTAWLGARHPELAGLVCINTAVEPPPEELLQMGRDMVADGETLLPAVGSDIANPDAIETSYPATPIAPALSMMAALSDLRPRLGDITSPMLVITSRQDHVVDPSQSDTLAASVSGPVERVWFDRSYHVITLDYDGEEVARRVVEFALKVTSAS